MQPPLSQLGVQQAPAIGRQHDHMPHGPQGAQQQEQQKGLKALYWQALTVQQAQQSQPQPKAERAS
jgi:hypothetical protein